MKREFKSKPFYYKLSGDYALFTDPSTRGGGEKSTYQVPTYGALKGITEQIYWKPSLQFYIDEVKVISRIETESMGARPLTASGNDLSYYTYLRNVEYYVKFHFEWNKYRQDLKDDWKEIKHQQIMLRSLDRGGRRDVFLGTRECLGFVERLSESKYEFKDSFYNGQNLSIGIMFHSFTYPDEQNTNSEPSELIANYANVQMEDGRIKFPRPEECLIHQVVRDFSIKSFNKKNMTTIDDEFSWYEEIEE